MAFYEQLSWFSLLNHCYMVLENIEHLISYHNRFPISNTMTFDMEHMIQMVTRLFESNSNSSLWIRESFLTRSWTAGLETIQERRGQKTDKPVLLTGPGKVSKSPSIYFVIFLYSFFSMPLTLKLYRFIAVFFSKMYCIQLLTFLKRPNFVFELLRLVWWNCFLMVAKEPILLNLEGIMTSGSVHIGDYNCWSSKGGCFMIMDYLWFITFICEGKYVN